MNKVGKLIDIQLSDSIPWPGASPRKSHFNSCGFQVDFRYIVRNINHLSKCAAFDVSVKQLPYENIYSSTLVYGSRVRTYVRNFSALLSPLHKHKHKHASSIVEHRPHAASFPPSTSPPLPFSRAHSTSQFSPNIHNFRPPTGT